MPSPNAISGRWVYVLGVVAVFAGVGADKAPRLILDPTFQPGVGLSANVVTRDGSPAAIATSSVAAGDIRRVLAARDRAGLEEMLRSGSAIKVESGTPVLIIEPAEMSRMAVASGSFPGRAGPTTTYADVAVSWVVRFQDGQSKDKTACVPTEYLARLVPPKSKGRAKVAAAAKGAAADPAKTAFIVASNLEKSGKKAAAKSAYDKLVRDYPNAPEASEAKDRLKELEGR